MEYDKSLGVALPMQCNGFVLEDHVNIRIIGAVSKGMEFVGKARKGWNMSITLLLISG